MKRKTAICLLVLLVLTSFASPAFAARTTTSEFTGEKYTHSSRYDNMMIVDGIDVSAWQEDIDWVKVKASGIDYVIIRIAGRGYGSAGTLYQDLEYETHLAGAKEAGLMIGVYFFSQAVNEKEAREEAQLTLKYLDGEELMLPVFMDYEFAGGSEGRLQAAKLSKAQMTKNARAFCETIEAAGYEAGLYANLSFLTSNIDGAALSKDYTIWAAQYYDECEVKHDYSIWQYSSSGKVSGISGRVDMDFWYLDPEPSASTAKSLADCDISFVSASYYLYNNGRAIEPEIIVTHNGTRLVEGRDYKIGYINNTPLGTGYVYVKGMGSYSDYQLVPFTICEELPQDIGIHADVDVTSSKYKFGDYVTGVDFSSTAESFMNNITVGEGLAASLMTASGAPVSGKTVVGTGTRLVITDSAGEVVGSAQIVIRGDCDGDGKCGLSDLLRIRKQIVGLEKYGGAQLMGLDANADGSVGLADLLAFRKHIVGIQEIKN